MLKQLLRNRGIELPDKEIDEILQITTDDIRENRIKFAKRTSLTQVTIIALRVYRMMQIILEKESPLPRA